MIDLNEGYPNGWFEGVSIRRLLDELNASTGEILSVNQPTDAMRRTHRTIINEISYRLNNLIMD